VGAAPPNFWPYHPYIAFPRIGCSTADYLTLIDTVQCGDLRHSEPGMFQAMVPTPTGPTLAWCFQTGFLLQAGNNVCLGQLWSGQSPLTWLAHGDRANAAFADGHGESCDVSRLHHLNNYQGIGGIMGPSGAGQSVFYTNGTPGPMQ
jgi:prepilin-type processing-associated H-X9-DG protein